jgi:hypothetical protein
VSVNTHKGFALEIFMTMAHILDEGVSSLSFRLEGVMSILGNCLGAPEQVDVHGGTLEDFWSMIAEELTNKEIVSGTPSSKFSLMDM